MGLSGGSDCKVSACNAGAAAPAAESPQSCPTLCDPIDGSPSGSAIPGILQARTLEWVAISFSSAGKWKVKVKSLSRVRLSDPMDCSPPGYSVHGILLAKMLEWVASPFSRGSFQPRDGTWVFCIADIFFTVWATRKAHGPGIKPLFPALAGWFLSTVPPGKS